jgi:hypothetical protein
VEISNYMSTSGMDDFEIPAFLRKQAEDRLPEPDELTPSGLMLLTNQQLQPTNSLEPLIEQLERRFKVHPTIAPLIVVLDDLTGDRMAVWAMLLLWLHEQFAQQPAHPPHGHLELHRFALRHVRHGLRNLNETTQSRSRPWSRTPCPTGHPTTGAPSTGRPRHDTMHVMAPTIYYLPGYGGQLATGLGQGLLQRGFNVAGRETRGGFKDLPFMEQVQTVADDLAQHFWQEDAHVVANSFGAYLFLHAQTVMPPFPGKVLLLSPIVGEFSNQEKGTTFSPPYPERLKTIVETGQFPAIPNAQIHVGEQDWQSVPADVQAFGDAVGIPVTVVPNAGHMLGKTYVGGLLDMLLQKQSSQAS